MVVGALEAAGTQAKQTAGEGDLSGVAVGRLAGGDLRVGAGCCGHGSLHAVQKGCPVLVHGHGREFMIIEPRAAHLGVVDGKAQRFDEVQGAAGVGAQADDVAGVGRDFGLDKDDVEHGGGLKDGWCWGPVLGLACSWCRDDTEVALRLEPKRAMGCRIQGDQNS